MKKYTVWILALACCAGHLSANVISVDLGKASTEALEASDVAGRVPASNWTVASGTPDLSGVALNYSDGAASGATLTADFSGNLTTRVGVTGDANTEMFNSGGGILGASGSDITVSGLSTAGAWAGGYDVYVYFAPSSLDNASRTLNLTIGGTSYYAELVTGSSNYSSTFDLVDSTKNWEREFGNYAVFSGVTGSSFTLNATSNFSGTIGLTGMQIVAVPEPATLGMLGIGSILVVIVRRWTR